MRWRRGSACKGLGRNGQNPAITPKATYTPIPTRAGSRSPLTRSPAQKSACKDLERDGQAQAIPPEAAYTPTSNRAGSRLTFHNALPSAGICV
ncbi:ATP-dependent nuclease subunit B [Lacticaseibacillus rhamnosus LRHMDP2]|nr:ATP-dependent nuclease subunit B [Lacticaseibacillus rhamnosus LRHMDP2]